MAFPSYSTSCLINLNAQFLNLKCLKFLLHSVISSIQILRVHKQTCSVFIIIWKFTRKKTQRKNNQKMQQVDGEQEKAKQEISRYVTLLFACHCFIKVSYESDCVGNIKQIFIMAIICSRADGKLMSFGTVFNNNIIATSSATVPSIC